MSNDEPQWWIDQLKALNDYNKLCEEIFGKQKEPSFQIPNDIFWKLIDEDNDQMYSGSE